MIMDSNTLGFLRIHVEEIIETENHNTVMLNVMVDSHKDHSWLLKLG